MSTPLSTYSVLKLPVHLCSDYSHWLSQRLRQNAGTHVVTLNAEMAMQGEKNSELGDIIKQAELVIPDGAGIIIYLKIRGIKQKRCAGVDLATAIMQEVSLLNDSRVVCFYGGKPGVGEKAAHIWQNKLANLQIFTQHGYISSREEQQWQAKIKKLQPRLVLVGLGVPRQELWIRDNRHLAPHAIWIGVGGSFDIWAGEKTRAPQWLRENYLEWLYRLYQEPWRWRRMLALPKFFFRSLLS